MTSVTNAFDGITPTSDDDNRKRSVGKRSRRVLIISLLVFIFISTALAVALILIIFLPKEDDVYICNTKGCTLAAATILKYLDTKQDPCQDFFSYVCGGYIKQHKNEDREENMFEESRRTLDSQLKELLESNNSESDPEAVRKLRKAYKVCMNTSHTTELGITPLAKFLELLGGWPLAAGQSWMAANGTKMEDLLAQMERMGFPSYIIGINISPDPLNNTQYKIQFDQPDELYKQVIRDKHGRKKRWFGFDNYDPMQHLVLAIVESLGNEDTIGILKDFTDVKRLKRDLSKIFTPQAQRNNHTRMYNKMNIRQLQNLTGNVFDFHKFLQVIFAGVTHISEDEEVIVCEMEFMQKWPSIIKKYSRRTLTNFAVWNAVEMLVQFITPELYLSASPTKTRVNVAELNKIRWKLCLSAVEDMLPYAVWRTFVDTYVDAESMDTAKELVDNLRKSYKRKILFSNWLDIDTKRNAVKKVLSEMRFADPNRREKNLGLKFGRLGIYLENCEKGGFCDIVDKREVNAMKEFVGFPNWILDDSKLNEYYENLEIIDNHFINVVVNRMNTTYRVLTSFRRPVNKELWVDETSFVNAYYSHLTNSIFFPAGILRPPFYGSDRIQALNYGSIGVIVGHEMGHGFDSDGSQFDEKGMLRRWWSDTCQEIYANRTKCFVDQYNDYCYEETMRKKNFTCINGEFTVGENMADNSGLQCSYQAYQRWVKEHGEEGKLPGLEDFSPNHLFFISHALTWCQTIPASGSQSNQDPHSPSKYRVQGPLSNSVEFAQLFNCPAGPMNRENQRCTLW